LEVKICTNCGQELPLSEFYQQKCHSKNKGEYLVYVSWCKKCCIQKNVERARKNKEKYTQYYRKYRKTEKYKKMKKNHSDRKRETDKLWRHTHKDKLREYRENHSHKHHEITKEELEQLYTYCNYSCMYCGLGEKEAIELYGHRLHKEHALNNGSNGIDNCVLACKQCNIEKNVLDWDQWYTEKNPKYDIERYIKIKEWLERFNQKGRG
jgi:hypothetical protein